MYTGSQQLYALHRTAPVGSFLVVHNESLNRSVRVKVIGEIPKNDANKKYIVKLSEAACEELGFNNREFYVRVVFRKMK
jgi:rare lipoprotein A (peptidoglycan hydrolase)